MTVVHGQVDRKRLRVSCRVLALVKQLTLSMILQKNSQYDMVISEMDEPTIFVDDRVESGVTICILLDNFIVLLEGRFSAGVKRIARLR